MIYLDSAATTFQKPAAVPLAVQEAFATMSSPGRGGYSAAMRAADMAFLCRSEAAELFHIKNPVSLLFVHYDCRG
jgi:selenocysteine lyase/cysteine desulfurase